MKIEIGPQSAIQALKNTLEEIPLLHVKKVSEGKNPSGPDFQMDLRIQNRPYTIWVEYKESGQPRLARQAAYELKDWTAKGQGEWPASLERRDHGSLSFS